MASLVICNLRVHERARYVFADTAKKCYSKYNKIKILQVETLIYSSLQLLIHATVLTLKEINKIFNILEPKCDVINNTNALFSM
jgi:hypothetical protein